MLKCFRSTEIFCLSSCSHAAFANVFCVLYKWLYFFNWYFILYHFAEMLFMTWMGLGFRQYITPEIATRWYQIQYCECAATITIELDLNSELAPFKEQAFFLTAVINKLYFRKGFRDRILIRLELNLEFLRRKD